MMTPNKSQFTLQRHWHSRKAYSFHKTFGAATPAEIPASLNMVTRILNQGSVNACTAYSGVAIREWMKKPAQFDPVAQWQEELAMLGNPNANGSDLQTEMATGVEKGFVPLTGLPAIDQASAYFTVTPTKSVFNPNGLDTYDAIKSAIALTGAPLCAGLAWYEEWVSAPGGIIPHTQEQLLGNHAIKIAGWTTINGVEYLIIQNSWGTENGDNGLYYFDRTMANISFVQGILYWSDTTVPNVQKMGLLLSLLQNLLDLLTQFAPGVAAVFKSIDYHGK